MGVAGRKTERHRERHAHHVAAGKEAPDERVVEGHHRRRPDPVALVEVAAAFDGNPIAREPARCDRVELRNALGVWLRDGARRAHHEIACQSADDRRIQRDADDRHARSVDRHRLANGFVSSTEAVAPESMADHRDRTIRFGRFVIARRQQASSKRVDAERGEEIAGDELAIDPDARRPESRSIRRSGSCSP